MESSIKKIKQIKTFLTALTALASVYFINFVSAAVPPAILPTPPSEDFGTSEQKIGLLTHFLPKTIDLILETIGGIALVVMLIGGIKMFTSEGKPDRFKKGLMTIVYGSAGLIIIGLAYSIVYLVSNINFSY